MKRVIDISEDAYELLLEKGTCGKFANLGGIVANSTPIEQEPTSYQWCTDCREYDQEKHCCHRWSKVIRNTVEEMKQEQEPKTGHWIAVEMEKYSDTYGHFTTHEFKCSNCGGNYIFNYHKYCPNCGAKMESEADNGNVD